MSLLQTEGSQTIRHLRQFYTPGRGLFQDARELPQFFKTNLVDDARVVKYFHADPQANIRIFYYQYLKLCFQIDNVDYESYIQKIYELIRTEGFEFYFDQPPHIKQHHNAQFKSLLIDFFQIMNSTSMTIDTVLTQYPILDQVFVNFFRSVLIIASVTPHYDSYIDKNQLFDFLSSFFSVDISSYDKCLKFVQSDIFVYEQDPENIYMAYIKDEQEEVQKSYENINSNNTLQPQGSVSQQNSFQHHHQNVSESYENPQITINLAGENNKIELAIGPSSQVQANQLKPRAKTIIKESYIEGEFADYTSFNTISAFGKNVPTDFQKQIIQTVQHKAEPRYSNNNSFFNTRQFCESKEQNDSKENPQTNSILSQNKVRMIESLQDQVQTGVNAESREKIDSEDLGNSKQSKREKSINNRNMLYQNFEEPTKDPGFGMEHHGLNVWPVESRIQSKKVTVSLESTSAQQSNSSLKKQEKHKIVNSNDFGGNKLITNDEPLFHKPMITMPTLLSQSSLSQNSLQVVSSNSKPGQENYMEPKLSIASVKETFKLNVTKQFTSSFVMKSMSEPFKSNVYQIRQKARQFRKNIYQQFNLVNPSIGTSNSYQDSLAKPMENPSSRTNLPSSSTLQKMASENHLASDSHLKSVSQIDNASMVKNHLSSNPNQPIYYQAASINRLGDFKQSTPASNNNIHNERTPVASLHGISQKEVNQDYKPGYMQNKYGPVTSMGPSIVVAHNSQFPNSQQTYIPHKLTQSNYYQTSPSSSPQRPNNELLKVNERPYQQNVPVQSGNSRIVNAPHTVIPNQSTLNHQNNISQKNSFPGQNLTQTPNQTNQPKSIYSPIINLKALPKQPPVYMPYERRT